MFTYKAFSVLLMLSVVKSEVDFKTTCQNDYRNLNNNHIDLLEYCSNRVCIEKCCNEGEMFHPYGTCINIVAKLKKHKKLAKLASDVDKSKIILYSWDGNTKKKSIKDFVFVKNQRNVQNCTSEHPITNDFIILEDGSLRMQDTSGSKSWYKMNRLEYCIDFKLAIITGSILVKLVVREYNADPKDEEAKSIFVLVGLLISSFFLILVLLVYCLLPKLRNLIGLVLMSYNLSILVTFIVKIVIHFIIKQRTTKLCKMIYQHRYLYYK